MGSSDEGEYKQTETKDAYSDDDFIEEDNKQKSTAAGLKRKRAAETSGDDSSSKKEDNNSFELSNKRRVFVKTFPNGQPSIDIRAIYHDKDGEVKYAKQGILLPLPQWNRLKELIPEIDEAIEKTKK
ncbi:hypothetical protein BDA99DRAFT_132600 [Phascolomyces articulosus]|uniref:Transcriptional coactivator p15 (PC4) C-terminal domain-containing protein n=1 Tax=Phascolomyces articulosus TaxID=60185 RepID=A0AAD5JW69_9FUNG|nr:hypothetical protein BDA99DRAFT_132600 [Phascolomyces articulosus]